MARRILHDEYFKKAKAEGYLARSAYKLLEIQERFRIIRAGDCVLDLGCAPGSWMQVAEKIVGSRGAVVGIDLSPVEHAFGPRVRVMRGDAFTTPPEMYADIVREIRGEARPAPKPAAPALAETKALRPSTKSGAARAHPTVAPAPPIAWGAPAERAPEARGASAAPRVFSVVLSDMAPSTSGHGDDLLSARLCRRVLELAYDLLPRGGTLAMKVLEGSENPALLRETRQLFDKVQGFKPKSSRDVSREMFIVAAGFKG